jgi:ketosteroid isomerase-like protein
MRMIASHRLKNMRLNHCLPRVERLGNLRMNVRNGLSAVVLLSVWCATASAGTCQDPGKSLTRQEHRNVKTACEQMAAAEAGWKDPEAGARRLRAIQADDFRFFIPTTDISRFAVGTRDDYIKLVTVTQRADFAHGRLNIYATTAQGNRVATEMESVITEQDGAPIHRKYHQIFIFNDEGKIRTYKIYMDTAAFVAEKKARNEKVVSQFLAGLSAAPPANLSDLLTDTVKWETMDRATVEKVLHGMPAAFRELHVTPRPDGFITQEDRVAVSALSNGIRANGEPYHNAYEFLFVLKGGKIDEIHGFAVGSETGQSRASDAGSKPADAKPAASKPAVEER